MLALIISLKILAAWLLADFLTGVIHWVQDLFMDEPFKNSILNSIKEDNDLHHKSPMAMLKFSYCENLQNSVLFAWPVALGLYLAGAPLVLWLAVFFGSFANVVHRWAHTPSRQRPRIVSWIQWTGLFASFDHHWDHHFDDNEQGRIHRIAKEHANIRFCVMTSWLNPILDKVQFFNYAEIVCRILIYISNGLR